MAMPPGSWARRRSASATAFSKLMGVGWGVAFGPEGAAAMDRQAFEIKRARQGFEEARFTDARASAHYAPGKAGLSRSMTSRRYWRRAL